MFSSDAQFSWVFRRACVLSFRLLKWYCGQRCVLLWCCLMWGTAQWNAGASRCDDTLISLPGVQLVYIHQIRKLLNLRFRFWKWKSVIRQTARKSICHDECRKPAQFERLIWYLQTVINYTRDALKVTVRDFSHVCNTANSGTLSHTVHYQFPSTLSRLFEFYGLCLMFLK